MRKKLINPLEHLWRHALLLAMLLETSGAWAQPDEATSFDLWVAGVEVTSENAADVTGALPTAAPQVYYNPETNVLTLDNADLKLELGSGDAIETEMSSLTVHLKGSSSITCYDGMAVAFKSTAEGGTTITFTTDEEDPGSLRMATINDAFGDQITTAYRNGLYFNNSGDNKYIEYLYKPHIYASYDDEDVMKMGMKGASDDVVELRYSIDYADAQLTDVTDALYDMEGDIPLLGPCTVTAYAKAGDTQSDADVGKLFGLAQATKRLPLSQGATVELPLLIPAVAEDDGIGLEVVSISNDEVAYLGQNKELCLRGTGTCTVTVALSIYDEESLEGKFRILNEWDKIEGTENDYGYGLKFDLEVFEPQDPDLRFYDATIMTHFAEVQRAEAVIGGETFVQPALQNRNELPVAYSSSNEQVATIDADGLVTLVGTGTTTITASSEATDEFLAGSAAYTLDVSRKLDISFGNRSWATYCAPEDLNVPNGITAAYQVTGIVDGTVTAEPLRCLPKGVGVLLERAEGGPTEDFVATAYGASTEAFDFSRNLLHGTGEATSVASLTDDDATIYVLYYDEFVKTTSGTIPACRAYLALPATVAPVGARLRIVRGSDAATAIDGVDATATDAAPVFDLKGRRLAGQPTRKGIYLKGGKKVVVTK